jgi:outer membrane protein
MNDVSRVALLAIGSLGVAGCSVGLFDNDRSVYNAPTERLHDIVTKDLAAESKKPPVTAEEATKQALERRNPKPEWPSQADVTLEEVRSETMRNNLDLRTQLVEPEIAQRTLDAERAKFEATLFASVSRSGGNLLTDPAFGDAIDNDNGTLGVQFPLVTGGTIDLSGEVSRTDSNAGTNIDGFGEWGTGVGFSISQPLLRNAGANVNTASIRIAEHDGQIASARTKLEVLRILADAEKVYWDVYGAYRDLEVRQQQFDLAMAQLERARRRVAEGDAPEIEVTRAESGVGGTIENIIVATGTLKERVRALKRAMNKSDMPVESDTLLVPKTQPTPLGLSLDAHELASRAIDNRMEMLELELQLASDAIRVAFQQNQALPNFVFDYTYQPFGQGEGAGLALSNIGDLEQDNYSVALRGEIPLGNEAAKNLLARAVLVRLQRLATKEARSQSIRSEVYDAVVRLETAWQRIFAARLETVLAARTYEGEKRQFDVGVRTSQDVLDASTRLADAQSREVNALAAWQKALVDIAFATGTLAGLAGATWAPIDVPQLETDVWPSLRSPPVDERPAVIPPGAATSEPTAQPASVG